MSVLAAIAVLALLIVVHESGHFLAARLQGIHVNRFSIGFGPILWKYQGRQTEYAVRAIPLGGFVGFPDDDPDSEIPPNDPNLLRNRPVLDRAIVISAGVIANLIFAYLVFATQLTVEGVQQVSYNPGVVISEVMTQDSPAAAAGLQSKDVVLAVDGKSLDPGDKTATEYLKQAIETHPGQAIDLTVQRGDQRLQLAVVPELKEDGVARIDVKLNVNANITHRPPHGIAEVLGEAAKQFQFFFLTILQGFASLITNFSAVAGQVAGPVKIVEEGAKSAAANAYYLFPFTAIISINLAIINILPLPALDGGQLVFLLIEALRGKPLPNRIQENVMQTGLVLLLGLGIFLIVRDTTQLEVFQRLFQ